MFVDMPGCLHTIELDAHADVAGYCCPLSSFVNWTGDAALPHHCCWGAQWVVAVIERLRDVVVFGSSDAVEGGGRSRW